MAYKISDRMTEWTSFAGAAVAAVSVVLPEFVPVSQWVHLWADAQLALGAAMIFIPQTTGTKAVENESLALLQAISGKVPPQYAAAVQPLLNQLARITVAAAPMAQVVRTALPAPTVAAEPAPAPAPVAVAEPAPAPAAVQQLPLPAAPITHTL